MADQQPQRTSAYLQRCLDETKGPVPNAFAATARDVPSAWNLVAGLLLNQFEGVTHVLEDAYIAGPRDTIVVALDDLLCHKFLHDVPRTVDRLMRLDRIVTEDNPSDSVHIYFRQAMRCYAMGLPLAAVALARSCLEQALREQVPDAREIATLEKLIDAAARVRKLDTILLRLARDVKRIGNQVMHRSACDDELAFTVILKVRALVEVLYGPAAEEDRA